MTNIYNIIILYHYNKLAIIAQTDGQENNIKYRYEALQIEKENPD